MRNSKLLLVGAYLFLSSTVLGQSGVTHPKYINEIDAPNFDQVYKNWVPGTPLYKGNPNEENEEFYISRVKPKERFADENTQVDPQLDSERKLLWWCPIGTANGGWNALPSYHFDSEVYSMWSYTDIYGNWTAPFIRMPAAFADICHKNGVRASVLASVPWAVTINSGDQPHGANMRAMLDKGPDFLLKFLRYYGIDGIGYNSEFTIGGGLSAVDLKNLLGDAFSKREALKWPTFTNAWYSLMQSSGSMGGSANLDGTNKDWFNYNGKTTSDAYFMNYGWGSSGLQSSQNTAQSFPGRSTYDVYAGMDFQGRNRASWIDLKNYPISVGIWGAHDMNMMFETRPELGSDLIQKQKTYQLISENVFTGASFNPVNTPDISNLLAHSAVNKEFHGFSKFITARSVLQGDIAENPFVTYFNLGNGLFFNVEGETTYPGQWYNIGIQDYLPSWRWWFTSKFMGRDKENVPTNGLKAEFTWEDAWFGGSCLAISGKTDLEYLQLFKTRYDLKAGDLLTIRYKVLSGEGSLAWSCMEKSNPGTEVSGRIGKIQASDEWTSKTISVGGGVANLKLDKKTMTMLGLKIYNTTSDFEVLIGEISLTRGTSVRPEKPTITQPKILAYNYKGIDFKVVFKMKDRPTGEEAEPIYNEDVNTWYYKIYMQQEGQQETMCTATTSWAAYVVSAPYNMSGSQKVRIGVSAVSMDGKSESDVAWSDYLTLPEVTLIDGIQVDKTMIKPNEEFTISYLDPNLPAAQKWEITGAQPNNATIRQEFTSNTSITTTLAQEGVYNLDITDSKGAISNYKSYIQISPEAVGTLPVIESLKANNGEEDVTIAPNANVEFSYIGKPADGKVSRGILLSERAFGIPGSELSNSFGTQPFTICFWLSPTKFTHESSGTQFLNIRTTADGWPASDWGYIWSTIGTDNTISFNYRQEFANGGKQTLFPNFTFNTNQWYHIAIVCDYQSGRKVEIYVNGSLIGTSGNFNSDIYTWKTTNYIMLGGRAFSRAGLSGYLDEYQLYKKALSASEVETSMKHIKTEDMSESLIGYWDFETDANDKNEFISTGKEPIKAYILEVSTASEGANSYQPSGVTYSPGTPFIEGNYIIETKPMWDLGKGVETSNDSGNALAGNVTAKYPNEGTFTAKLTLNNGWGSDSKTFQYIIVDSGVGIDNSTVGNYSAFPNPFVDEVNVQFANAGTFDIEIHNLAGQTISTYQRTIGEGEFFNIKINGDAGSYFVTIKENSKILKTLKVIKK